MSIEIESRNPGILVHVLRKELNEMLAQNPYLKKSIKMLITSHDKLLILMDETLDSEKAINGILRLVEKLLKDYTVRKLPRNVEMNTI
jgi:hypothetical protein|uniref:Uncharacterized protein n=1 Tax=Ignisphaera aggregans TaxID=334771 RepID=A0A7J2U4C3_9CREN